MCPDSAALSQGRSLTQPPSALSQAMAGAGIVSGFDMTSEAALAKLSYVLGQPGLSLDDRKKVCTPWTIPGTRAPLCTCVPADS